ncbi:hypothetical protein C5167_051033 [Papaver somniferum]|uniref:NFACT RNA-binding domain-containing protein n=2 Tax=Papaver somniferum TaxID=3469 RepID=A0A4Y7KQB6_PAPSO|nr:hypothetical protein C5167_051033 [Papaver somniferum]
MVLYFSTRSESGGELTIFMGLDKHENEDLIKYGLPEDIWFHVDKMSSAHVYLRLRKGQTMDDISEDVLQDCVQLVKSQFHPRQEYFILFDHLHRVYCGRNILALYLMLFCYLAGNKVNNIDVVYTPWSNLKKTASMDVGQVGFHNTKMVRTVRVDKRNNDIVNRLNKTKVERKTDLKAEREAVDAAERTEKKHQQRDKKRHEDLERLEKEKQAELRSYKGLMVSENMTSNKQIASGNKSMQEMEEDFM